MPPPASADELLDLVRKSGVADDAKLQAYVMRMSSSGSAIKDPKQLATGLVRDGLLTYFQAEQLLLGKWKRFSIGKYKVLEKLGAGGMGQVFLCEHKLMRRRVAVKVLPTAKAEDDSSRERFYREARAIAAVDHPNLVRAYDIDQDDNLHFLVMEYVDGSNFHDIVKKFGPMDVNRAVHYVYGASVGLQHAHEMGLVHRDIKPGNILVDRTGVVKILDMGLARFFHDEDDVLTKKYDENVLGTADYLSPEQALDSHGVDIRSDIYSLGATFYYMVGGRPPFPDGSVAQKLIWHQSRTPESIKSLRPDLPDGLVAIIEKMMEKDADDRYQTPSELMAALAPWVTTPIGPPPEREMPSLSPAATGAVVGTSMRGPATTTSTARTVVAQSSGGHQALIVTPPPLQATPPDGNGVWESLDSETQSVAQADTDRKGHRASPPGDARKAKPMWSRRALIAGGIGLVLVGAVVAFFAFGKKQPPPDSGGGPGPKRLVVTRAGGEGTFPTLGRALARATHGDTVVIRDERLQEPMLKIDARTKDLTIESDVPGGKPAVIEYTSLASTVAGVIALDSVQGFRLRNVEIDARGTAEAGVQVTGYCPGLVLENVTIRAARVAGVRMLNAGGEAGQPIALERVRVIQNANTDGVLAVVTGTLETKRVAVRNCRFEGNDRGKFGVRIDGPAAELEVTGCRFYKLESGVAFGKLAAGREAKVQLTGNTFYDVAAGLHFEVVPNAPPGKFAVAVSRNYFARAQALARRTDASGVFAEMNVTDNAFDQHSAPGNLPLTATRVEAPELQAPNPDDDATFLRFPAGGPEVGANKTRVGAN